MVLSLLLQLLLLLLVEVPLVEVKPLKNKQSLMLFLKPQVDLN